MTEGLLLALKIIATGLTIVFVSIRLAIAIISFRSKRRASALAKALNISDAAPQFTKHDIEEAVSGYIKPECSIIDPVNTGEIAAFSDVRQDIFKVIDNSITFAKTKQFQLILADSGMGKTSFCLNYFLHFRKLTKTENIVLISLASSDADDRIKAVTHKSAKVAVLDALDEDPAAIRGGNNRLYEILDMCRDFQSVIITCRSQFFANDLAIPSETGVSMVVPRKASQNSTYTLSRLYLTPFNPQQVKRYLNLHFPLWYIWNIFQRRRAIILVETVKELSSRPMLLELLPELVKSKNDAEELFDLYRFMVDRWLARESNWIDPEKLLTVSKKLAVYIHNRHAVGGGDRVKSFELSAIANDISYNDSQWDHLTTRSLVNRDSKGLFKFAHRSVMEYLFVLAAINGDKECLSCRWTDFMKELFISWGYTVDGAANIPMAETIINSANGITGLLPLSEAPVFPTNVPDFNLAVNRNSKGGISRRQATPLWRINSIRIDQNSYSVKVSDLEFYKQWLLSDVSELTRMGLHSTFSDTVANIQKAISNDEVYRAPSYAEFVTLLEGLSAIGRAELLPDNVLYYIGDKMGDRRHLLVSVSKSARSPENKFLILRDKARYIPAAGRYLSVYEIGMYADVAGLHTVKAVPLRVANGLDHY